VPAVAAGWAATRWGRERAPSVATEATAGAAVPVSAALPHSIALTEETAAMAAMVDPVAIGGQGGFRDRTCHAYPLCWPARGSPTPTVTGFTITCARCSAGLVACTGKAVISPPLTAKRMATTAIPTATAAQSLRARLRLNSFHRRRRTCTAATSDWTMHGSRHRVIVHWPRHLR